MELSELQRATARFQTVVSSLLAPGRGAQLLVHEPLEVRLQVGTDTQRGVPVIAQVVLLRGADAAELQAQLQQPLDLLAASRTGAEDKRFHLRIIVVTTPAAAQPVDAALRAISKHAPASPVLQAFQVSSDGAVRSAASLLFSEVGPALREQAKRPLSLLPDADFAAVCEQALDQTRTNMGEVQDLAQTVQGRGTPVTYGLLALNVLLFALSYLWGSPDELATLGRMGAAAPQRILAGEWWRLLAATALHGGLMHLAVNSLGLWNLGRLLEPLLGSARFMTLYAVSGLCGSLLGTALGSLSHFSTSVGASGAICGLLGACGAIGLRPRGDLPAPVAYNFKRMALLNLGMTAFISLQPHVDWRAHLGGALAGALLTLVGLVRPTVRTDEAAAPQSDSAHLLFATLWAGLLVLSIGVAIQKGQPWLLVHPEQRQRIAVAGTPLSVEVPRSLGRGEAGTSGAGTTTWLFHDWLLAPLALDVKAFRFSSAAERERFIATHWGAYINAAQKSAPPFTTSERTISGLPTLALSRANDKVQELQLFQAREEYMVALLLQIPADLPKRMIPNLEELLATFQDEPR